MDNTSIPSITNDLFVSSNGLQQSRSLSSSGKKHVPNDKEMIFINTLRNIKDGRISKQEPIESDLEQLMARSG